MKNVKNTNLIVIGIVLAAFAMGLQYHLHDKRWDDACTEKLTIHEKEIEVCLAESDQMRSHGLSGTKDLAQGKGMLFEFAHLGNYGFWMKDMNYPIDIIWFDENMNEVHRVTADPESFPTVFYPPVFAQYVLETNVGEVPKR